MHYHEFRHEMKNPHFKKAMERIAELEAENAALRRERDDALRAAWAVRDLATTPISDEDVARAIEEAMRVRPAIARKQADRISSLEEENRRMREALDLFWSQSLAIETLARRAYGESSQIYQNVLAAILKAQEFYKNLPKFYKNLPKATRAALSQEEKP